jgi:hypothetical protein
MVRDRIDRRDRYFGRWLFLEGQDKGHSRTSGYFECRQGVVGVMYYVHEDALQKRMRHGLYLSLILGGFRHTRIISGRPFTERGIVRIARRWAKEVQSAWNRRLLR